MSIFSSDIASYPFLYISVILTMTIACLAQIQTLYCFANFFFFQDIHLNEIHVLISFAAYNSVCFFSFGFIQNHALKVLWTVLCNLAQLIFWNIRVKNKNIILRNSDVFKCLLLLWLLSTVKNRKVVPVYIIKSQ